MRLIDEVYAAALVRAAETLAQSAAVAELSQLAHTSEGGVIHLRLLRRCHIQACRITAGCAAAGRCQFPTQ